MGAVKLKKCKYCKSEFKPFRTTQKHCLSKDCVNKEIMHQEAKKWHKRKSEMKDRLLNRTDYLKKAQKTFNAYIRHRDSGKEGISCGKPMKAGNIDAGHLWSSGGHSFLRFNEMNVNAQCSRPCNKDKSGDVNNYRLRFVHRWSQDDLDWLDANAHREKKWSIDELKEIISIYSKKIKQVNPL